MRFKYFLPIILLGFFILFPKNTYATATVVRFYNQNYEQILEVPKTDAMTYSLSNVKYIRIYYNDHLDLGSCYLSGLNFEIDTVGSLFDINTSLSGFYNDTGPIGSTYLSTEIIERRATGANSYYQHFRYNWNIKSNYTTEGFYILLALDTEDGKHVTGFKYGYSTLDSFSCDSGGSSSGGSGSPIVDFTETNQKIDSVISYQDKINQEQIETNKKLDDTNKKLDDTNKNLNNVQKEQEKTNQNLDKIDNTLNDDDTSAAEDKASSFFNDFEDNNHGLSGVVTAPLEFIQALTSSKCEPLKFKLPMVKNDVTLPCMKPIYKEHFGVFFTLWQLITTGLISYNVCLNIYKKVRDLQNPNNDRIEVLDL